MTKKITQAQQSEAYDHGYRSFDIKRGVNGVLGAYVNPYDSDKYWLLFMAYEQGWNDRREAPGASPMTIVAHPYR